MQKVCLSSCPDLFCAAPYWFDPDAAPSGAGSRDKSPRGASPGAQRGARDVSVGVRGAPKEGLLQQLDVMSLVSKKYFDVFVFFR